MDKEKFHQGFRKAKNLLRSMKHEGRKRDLAEALEEMDDALHIGDVSGMLPSRDDVFERKEDAKEEIVNLDKDCDVIAYGAGWMDCWYWIYDQIKGKYKNRYK